MKLYVIQRECQDYDDYDMYIVGIFDEISKANLYMKELEISNKRKREFIIHEFELNKGDIDVNKKYKMGK